MKRTIIPITGYFEFWRALQAAYEIPNNDMWVETTQERFYEQLGAVPPLAQSENSFLGSEPWNHTNDGKGIYICIVAEGNKYYARYMTHEQYEQMGREKWRLLTDKEQIVYHHLNGHLNLANEYFAQLTDEQKLSAARVILHQGYGVKSAFVNDEYLGIQFSHIFIGIEKDGYAHS